MWKFLSINLVIILFFSSASIGKEIWILDKEISTIKFELPVLLAKNIYGEFKQIEGIVEIDIDNKENNKAKFSIIVRSIEINYNKYKNLILGNIFFNAKKFPDIVIKTKKFSYKDNQQKILKIELNIKNIIQTIPIKINVNYLTDEIAQITGEGSFARSKFKIGINEWSSTKILKDIATVKINLFLFKK